MYKDLETMNIKNHEVDISELKIEGESSMKNCDLWHLQSARLGIKASEIHNNEIFDMVIAHYSTDLVFMPRDTIKVYHIHGVPSVYQTINDNAIRIADHLISHTRQNAQAWSKLHDLEDSEIEVIHLGIDCEKYSDKGVVRDNDIVFVGRLIPNKGVDLLLKAVSDYDKKLNVIIIGDGPEKESLNKIISDENLVNTRIVSGMSDEEVIRAYNKSKIAVFPSTSKEGIILSMLEAAGCGCAIVTSDCCGMPEFTGGQSLYGTLVKPGAVEGISKSIAELIENESYRNQRGKSASLRVRNVFSEDRSNEKLKKYYKRVFI